MLCSDVISGGSQLGVLGERAVGEKVLECICVFLQVDVCTLNPPICFNSFKSSGSRAIHSISRQLIFIFCAVVVGTEGIFSLEQTKVVATAIKY